MCKAAEMHTMGFWKETRTTQCAFKFPKYPTRIMTRKLSCQNAKCFSFLFLFQYAIYFGVVVMSINNINTNIIKKYPFGKFFNSKLNCFLFFLNISIGTKRDSKQDNRLYINLPPHRQEEVERLLQEGGGRGWRQVGAALGYEPEQLDLFGRGEAPAHTLLSNWAQKEGSTLGLLCSALARIERPDVVTVLNSPTQGVSVV